MSANFDLSDLALKAVCPGNEILYDDKGLPSIMVKIPKLTYAQLGMGESNAVHPAFIVNGQEIDALWISKYINVVQNGRAYSLPGVEPANNMTFDTARGYCEAKGAGWHMMTRMEWGLILRWCQNNGVMPKGNNNYGKHSTETSYKAIPTTFGTGADASKIYHTAVGTGPLTWYHDQSPSGIADLVGDISEWHGGIRRVGRELQILANNNGADSSNPQTSASTAWKAIDGTTGDLITPNGSGTTENSIKMQRTSGTAFKYVITDPGAWSSKCEGPFSSITCDEAICDEAKLLLADLGMLQYNGQTELFSSIEAYLYCDNGERLFYSGCNYGSPARGLASFASSTSSTRSNALTGLGFRSAYCQLPAA